MATFKIRNIPTRLIRGLESLAKRRNTLPRQIEASWSRQARRPSAAEIESWITAGRG